MERNVVEIPKEAVLDQLPSGKHETDDGDAREDKRYPKPASFPGNRCPSPWLLDAPPATSRPTGAQLFP